MNELILGDSEAFGHDEFFSVTVRSALTLS